MKVFSCLFRSKTFHSSHTSFECVQFYTENESEYVKSTMAERVHLFTAQISLHATPNLLHAITNAFHAIPNAFHAIPNTFHAIPLYLNLVCIMSILVSKILKV